MNIFGIGLLELFFIILIAVIVLGPKDMVKTARTLGRFLNRLVKSENWRLLQRASNEIRNLPTALMREANLEDTMHDLNLQKIEQEVGLGQVTKELSSIESDLSDWTQPKNPLITNQSNKSDDPEATKLDVNQGQS